MGTVCSRSIRHFFLHFCYPYCSHLRYPVTDAHHTGAHRETKHTHLGGLFLQLASRAQTRSSPICCNFLHDPERLLLGGQTWIKVCNGNRERSRGVYDRLVGAEGAFRECSRSLVGCLFFSFSFFRKNEKRRAICGMGLLTG